MPKRRFVGDHQRVVAEIEVFLITGATNARTEAANTSIKQLKRTYRGYRNAEHDKVPILLRSAARRAT